jgi:hypothetical protein
LNNAADASGPAMPDWTHIGKTIVLIGLIVAVIGGVIVLIGKLPGGGAFRLLGKLPGDIYIEREHFTFYFPIATGLVISVVLTLLFTLLSTFLKR